MNERLLRKTVNPFSLISIKYSVVVGIFILMISWKLGISQNNIRLSGYVHDSDTGNPLPAAIIRVEDTEKGALTNESGYFEIENLQPGIYNLTISLLGYENENINRVQIYRNQNQRIQILLKEKPIAGDSVLVSADFPRQRATVEGDKVILSFGEIEAYRQMGLENILHQVAGVQVESNGSSSGRGVIRIHGSKGNQVLVLLDGQRLNNPQTGEVDLSVIPLEQIEKIEIIRQGNATIYGSNAFAGVVSFKTRNRSEVDHVRITSQFGSFSTASGNVGSSVSWENLGLITSYRQAYSRQNFNYQYQKDQYTRENAWYRNKKLFSKLNIEPQDHRMDLLYQYRQGEQGLPSAYFEEMNHFRASKKDQTHTFQINHHWYVDQNSYLKTLLSYHELTQLFNNENDLSPFTRYKSNQVNRNYEAKVGAMFEPAASIDTRLGFHYLKEELDHENLLFPSLSVGLKQRSSVGAYGSFEYTLPILQEVMSTAQFRTAFRYEKYFDQQPKAYPLFGLSMVPAFLPSLNLSAGWSRAVRYPDFNSLFWKGDARARGNPELRPERKTIRNLSVRWIPQNSSLPQISIYYYNESIEDLIFWHRGVNGIWQPKNEQRVSKEGVDIDVKQKMFANRFYLNLNYSYIDAINKSSEPNRHNRRIVFTPQHTLNTSGWLKILPFELLATYRFVSQREVVPANTGIPLNTYGLWDLSISYQKQIHPFHLDMDFAVKNITSTSYELIRGYPMSERHFQISVKLKYQKK